jgi:hypothetical protein
MGKRARSPLENKGREIRFYHGDWDRFTEILAPLKLTPSEVIRDMVRKKIKSIDERVNQKATEVADVELGE